MDHHLPLPTPFCAADLQLPHFPDDDSAADLQLPHFSDDDSAANNNTNPDQAEVTRRPRGRPAGSKNKPKPPVIIARDSANSLTPHVMEIAAGCDIVESLTAFTMRRKRGLCILSGSGAVTNVTFHQRSSPSAVVSLPGPFEILTLSGSLLPPPAPEASSSLTVYLSGRNQQVVGGIVAGPLVASRPVEITAASFADVAYERLPPEEGEQPGMLNAASVFGVNENQSMMTVANSNYQLQPEPYWGGSNHPA